MTGLVVAVVLVGAAIHRMTGFGFALVVTPVLAVLVGPSAAVSSAAVLSCLLSVIILGGTFRDVLWRPAIALGAAAAISIPAGQLVASAMPEPALLVVVGLMTVCALVASALVKRSLPDSGRTLLATGVAAGTVNVTAGVGGSVLASYATARRWDARTTVATSQIILLAMGVATPLSKGVPGLPAQLWGASAMAVIGGAVVGGLVGRRTSHRLARRAVIVLGLLGGIAATSRGLATLFTG